MSKPTTKEQVFEEIQLLAEANGKSVTSSDPGGAIRWYKEQFRQMQVRHYFMAHANFQDFVAWKMSKNPIFQTRDKLLAEFPRPTARDFWQAAWDFKISNNPADGSSLQKLIMTGRLEPVPIGKVYGETLLKLIPAIGALPASEIPKFTAHGDPFDIALTNSGAISYPDGHPSEEEVAPKWEPAPDGSMRSRFPAIKPADDDKLRRFAALGWVIQKSLDGNWNKTGHVLVIDMDDKAIRQRQPWLVLASEWPADGELPGGGWTVHAEERVGRNDRSQPGVLPPDSNRTPICRITPKGKGKTNAPVLMQLGENFNFEPLRQGGGLTTGKTRYGPGLARVMDWFWDDQAQQEVCYTKQGLEYMRYDPGTKSYTFPDFSSFGESLIGEAGFSGEIESTSQATPEEPYGRKKVSLVERLAGSNIGGPGPSSKGKAPNWLRKKLSTSDF